MSRNLCRTDCYYCFETVAIAGERHPITEDECGPYFSEYQGMVVANAVCTVCEAKYLAWCTTPKGWGRHRIPESEFFDLSFRSSFNDEPGDDDLPKWKITWEPVKTPWVDTR